MRPFLIGCSVVLLSLRALAAGWPVIDVANLQQSMLQVANMIKQLKNMSEQIQTYSGEAFGSIGERVFEQQQGINAFLRQLNSMGYQIETIQSQFSALFPKNHLSPTEASTYRRHLLRWQDELRSASLTAMQAQTSVDRIYAQNREIERILTQSQSAGGTVRQLQSTNRLLGAIGIRLTDLATLQATSARLMATAAAVKSAQGSEAQAQQKRFWSNYRYPRVKPRYTRLP